ncbi:CDP-glycerol glycerophosphotransferase family protein [Terrilactibacillus sp. S3-3]|nr:CDP-glycerol glycerophosphotransferase family protein [Terrilactibacillus sp. S3-3]
MDYVQKKRDFYYDYRSFIPGPLVKSTNDIIRTIRSGDFQMEKVKPFVHYFFDQIDGESSARVVDQLILGNDGYENFARPKLVNSKKDYAKAGS